MVLRATVILSMGLLATLRPASGLHSWDHKAITQNVAIGRDLQFALAAANLLSDAAPEPDARDWNDLRVHCQTPNDKDGHPTLTAAQAMDNCITYVKEKSLQFRRELSQGNIGNALYILGYTLHTIQDLAPHRGMSNFDHSFLSFHGNDPDSNKDNVKLATEWTLDFMQAVRAGVSHCAWQRLQSFSERSRSTDHGFEPSIRQIPPIPDLWDYRKLKNLDPSAVKFVSFSREKTYPLLKAAFVSGLTEQDDLPWLLEGEWILTSGKVITLKSSPGASHYQLVWDKRTWDLKRSGSTLSGESLMGADFLRSSRVPEDVLPNVVSRARGYLTAEFSEKTCDIHTVTEQDRVWWETDRRVKLPRGYGIGPKDPRRTDKNVLKWKRSVQ